MSAANIDADINHYFIMKQKLGSGGMGQVFQVYDRLARKDVALKLLLHKNISLTDIEGLHMAFASEFQTLASLRHPHIIEVYTYGFSKSNTPYYTMQLLPNAPSIIVAAQYLPVRQKLSLVVQMLRALLYLHHRGIIHRDIKPGNVLVGEDGVRILDFGLAAAANTNVSPTGTSDTIEGTLAYLAPEIFHGDNWSIASDLYAVGIILYQMLTGKHPFPYTIVNQLITSILSETPDLDTVRQSWQSLKRSAKHQKEIEESRTTSIHKAVVPLVDTDDSVSTVRLTTTSEDGETLNFAAMQDQVFGGEKKSAPKEEVPPTVVLKDTTLFLNNEYQDVASKKMSENTIRFESDGYSTGEYPAISLRALTDSQTEDIIVRVIERLLAKNPQKRYQDAAEVIRDLSHALGEDFPIETQATRESFLQAAEFIERKFEFDLLRTAVDNAMSGEGAVWMVGGEQGIGKTRLLEELQTHALVKGAVVTKCSAEQGLSYSLWCEPLRHLVLDVPLDMQEIMVLKEIIPDIDQLLGLSLTETLQFDPNDRQQRLFNVVKTLLVRQKRPIVILLDDIHRASSENILLLRHLSQSLASLPILIVATFNTDEDVSQTDTLAGIQHEGLTLQRFSYQATARLSESMLGVVGRQAQIISYLHEQTQGNILFMIELIRALAEVSGQITDIAKLDVVAENLIPKSLYELLQLRLKRVPAYALLPLQMAALLGRQLEMQIMEQVVTDMRLEEWLNVCANIKVLEFTDGRWQFAHQQLLEFAANTIAEADKQALHRQCAMLIAQAYPNEASYAGRIADHWQGAGDGEQETRYRLQAADHAYRISAFHEANSNYQRLYELLPSDDIQGQIAIQNRIASTHLAQDNLSEALEIATTNFQQLEAHPDAQLLADTQRIAGRVYMVQGQFDKAIAYFDDAFATYKTLDKPLNMADTLLNKGRLSARMGRFEDGIANAQQALDLLRRENNDWTLASTLNLLASLNGHLQHLVEAKSLALQALAAMKKVGNREGMAGIQTNLGLIHMFQDKSDEAIKWLRQSLIIYDEIRQDRGQASCLNNMGMVAMQRHENKNAKQYFEEALSHVVHLQDPFFTNHIRVNLARMQLLLKDYDVAKENFKQVIQVSQSMGAMPLLLEALVGLSRLYFEQGEGEKAGLIHESILQLPALPSDVEALLKEVTELLDKAQLNGTTYRDIEALTLERLVEVVG